MLGLPNSNVWLHMQFHSVEIILAGIELVYDDLPFDFVNYTDGYGYSLADFKSNFSFDKL